VQQWLQRAEAEDLVKDVLRQMVAVQRAERGALFANKLQNNAEQALPSLGLVGLNGGELCTAVFSAWRALSFSTVVTRTSVGTAVRVGGVMYIDTSGIAITSKHSQHRSSICYVCKNEKNFFFADPGSAAFNPLTIWFAQRESA
jgi:hypothetical protein